MKSLLLVLASLLVTTACGDDSDPGDGSANLTGGYLVWMNREGGTYTQGGVDDSQTNETTVLIGLANGEMATIQPFPYGDATWQSVMPCVRDMFGPFQIEIVDEDPGTREHIESVVAGFPADANFTDDTGGIASVPCDTPDANSIAFTFPGAGADDPQEICETATQEIAHAFGLDHELNCLDPMTYLDGCGAKNFQDEDSPCGEDVERECECGGATQNSFQTMRSILGPAS